MAPLRRLAITLGLAAAALLPAAAHGQHVVFVTGDEEYRSEESMPMLARILEEHHGMTTTVLYAVGADGYVDPTVTDNIPGLAALDSAALMVLFTRFRALPDSQLAHIVRYAESGRPMVGFRTATHAFRYPEESPHAARMNDEWPRRVFGQRWIVHHGHFDDGEARLTSVRPLSWRTAHPVLRGVEPFEAYSWLYHVDGGGEALEGDSRPLLVGEALRSTHAESGELERYPLTNPVAWTRTYTGESGAPARVFFTTLGHPFDFQEPSMRRLAVNGILWALGLEERIPEGGAASDIVGEYRPNNSGFGRVFKEGLRPEP